MKTVIECPKCAGQGHIRGMEHIAGGVCFHCNGERMITLTIEQQDQVQQVTDDNQRRENWILQATQEQVRSLNWKQMYEARAFALCGHPDHRHLEDVWFEKFEQRYLELARG